MSEQEPSGDHDSWAANQGKTESMPPAQGHADPDAAPRPRTVERPDLGSMNVGAGDPQAPSHPAIGGPDARGVSAGPGGQPPVLGGHQPGDLGPEPGGRAQRAPGSDGVPAASEQIETDVARSAANTDPAGTPGTAAGPGDAAGVPVVSEQAAPGTGEQSAVAQGSRTPQ